MLLCVYKVNTQVSQTKRGGENIRIIIEGPPEEIANLKHELQRIREKGSQWLVDGGVKIQPNSEYVFEGVKLCGADDKPKI